MARARYRDNAVTFDGLSWIRIPNATVTLFVAGTTTPYSGTIYAGPTGGATLTNPFTTNASGDILFYLDSPTDLKVQIAGVGVPAFSMDMEPALPSMVDLLSQASGVYYLENFAGGVVINTGVNSAIPAFATAFAAIPSGGKIVLAGNSTYLCSGIVPPSNITIEGAGASTILKHPNGTNDEVIDCTTGYNITLRNFRVDGNRANNKGSAVASGGVETVIGWGGAEIALGGNNNAAENIEVFNFNGIGFDVSGVKTRVSRCRAIGINAGTYSPTQQSGTIFFTDYQSLYGFLTPTTAVSSGLYMEDCYAYGTRSGGFSVGGTDVTLVRPHAENCHRGPFPYQTVGGTITTGGGQISVTATWDGTGLLPGAAGNQPATGLSFVSPQAGPTTSVVGTALAIGIEIGAAFDLRVTDPYVHGQTGTGISIADGCARAKVEGGTIKDSGANYGLRVHNSTHVTVKGVSFHNNPTHVYTEGTSDYLNFAHFTFSGSGTNFSLTASGTHVNNGPHHFATGTASDETMTTGLQVLKSVASQYAGQFTNKDGSGLGLLLRAQSVILDAIRDSDGALLMRLLGGGKLQLSTPDTSAAVRAMVEYQEANSARFAIGMDASDRFAILASDLATPRLTVDPTNGNTLVGGVVYPNGLSYGLFGNIQTIASGASFNLGTTAIGLAMFYLVNTGDGALAFFHNGANVVSAPGAFATNFGGAGTGFTIGSDPVNTGVNIWHDGTSYKIHNRHGSQSRLVVWIGLGQP